ncbi:MAG: DNA polymerase I [Lachnospiraceae bacterium]|nr:DNA polymerase I [Lachnospiraceae bacterium]
MYENKKLLLIDGHSILNRAFYGVPDLTNGAGVHTNAVYGFLNIMFKLMETENPDYLMVAFDRSEPTFRHKKFSDYKGTRKPMLPELKQQVPMIQQLLSAMTIPVLSKAGWEADDILGTIAFKAQNDGMKVTIVSGDRDLLQLCTDNIKIALPRTKKTGTEVEHYFAKDFIEKTGVTPTEFIDVKALMGDSSDNIPGVPGIGEKTAYALIQKYHNIDAVHEDAENVKPPRASKNIVEFWEQAKESKWLATISLEADIEFNFNNATLDDIYTEEAYLLCKEWELKNILSRFDAKGPNNEDVEKNFHIVSSGSEVSNVFETLLNDQVGCSVSFDEKDNVLGFSFSNGDNSYFFTKEAMEECLIQVEFQKVNHRNFKLYITDIKSTFTKLNYTKSPLGKELLDFFLTHRKICGVDGFYDSALAAYLINPLISSYPTEALAKEYMGILIPTFTDKFGKEKASAVYVSSREELGKLFCYDSYVACKSSDKLNENLTEMEMMDLFLQLEMPLLFTLYDMEREGIICNRSELEDYGKTLKEGIDKLEASIYEACGEEFNINSPKQLGVILFEKLGFEGGKKTKTGYSTAADVLEKLAPKYPVIHDILEYRTLSKLKSTYADGLDKCIEDDGRIHTTFQQMVTATGRLSSTEPNLQNIPMRLELGKMIRKVFYPKEGFVFVDADYSQIELRVLAHMSGDENLIQAYKENKDIHRATASLVFHTPFEEVTELQRSNAKAVNFGIVYGISSFGLGQDLNISRKDAQKYIDDYYRAYPKLKIFLDKLVAEAKDIGYCKTIKNRRRPVPEISSGNFMQRGFGERIAMNSPIQGSAADIIKIAMLRVHDRLLEENLESRLILQVHDELLIEAKMDELEKVHQILEEEMHGAMDLLVPLEIDMHDGNTWYDAK